MKQNITLETNSLALSFDQETGSLTGLQSKVSDWTIIKRPELGLSWKIMLPLEGKRNNNAWGHQQQVKPECRFSDDFVEFTWKSIESEYGGTHKISITTICQLVEDQAVFKMTIANNDQVMVENVYYPYIGDLYRPDGCQKLAFMHGAYCGLREYEMYPRFPNPIGTHSVDYPTLTISPDHANPPMYPFGLISDQAGNGLYIGLTERRIEPVTWHAEALPGWRNSNDFKLFDSDTAFGKTVFTRFAAGHFPFTGPGESSELLPFAMQAYRGDWTVGTDCYRKISQKWNKLPAGMPQWAKQPHSWLQIHINSPEDELRIKFKDLPKIAEECQRFGVRAIQLVGWNDGGQDRGNPSHSPDPRLGTFDELKQAISQIKQMGIKLILFAKFVWADQSRDDFNEKYLPHAIKNPYGDYSVYKGYQYMTLSQMADVNTRRLVPMCFGSEEYLKICNQEFMKCVELGADGILYDECLHHSPTLCCFDPSHQHRYGESSYKFDEKLIDGFRELVKDREFLIAGEAIYDFQHNYYDISYTRTWGRNHQPTSRYMRPDGKIMSAVVGFNDRSMINQCLLNNYMISYEPYNFKGMLSDYPETVAYGSKMDQLRADLAEYFWDGEFLARQKGLVSTERDEVYQHYSVFRTADGKYGMVICNYDEDHSISVNAVTDQGFTYSQYRLVDQNTMNDIKGPIEIPPESAVVII